MKKIATLAVLGSVIAVCVGVALPTPAQSAGTAPVLVLNTAADPVPVALQGTGSIAGTVDARQGGAWTVGISSLPAVQLAAGTNVSVSSTPASPIYTKQIEDAVDQAVAVDLCVGSCPAPSDVVSLPAGKRFIIEQISGRCVRHAYDPLSFYISAPLDGKMHNYYVRSQQHGDTLFNDHLLVVNDQTRIYADGSVSISRVNVETDKCEATLAGRLVAIPPPVGIQ
jgi:hypothetical protein